MIEGHEICYNQIKNSFLLRNLYKNQAILVVILLIQKDIIGTNLFSTTNLFKKI